MGLPISVEKHMADRRAEAQAAKLPLLILPLSQVGESEIIDFLGRAPVLRSINGISLPQIAVFAPNQLTDILDDASRQLCSNGHGYSHIYPAAIGYSILKQQTSEGTVYRFIAQAKNSENGGSPVPIELFDLVEETVTSVQPERTTQAENPPYTEEEISKLHVVIEEWLKKGNHLDYIQTIGTRGQIRTVAEYDQIIRPILNPGIRVFQIDADTFVVADGPNGRFNTTVNFVENVQVPGHEVQLVADPVIPEIPVPPAPPGFMETIDAPPGFEVKPIDVSVQPQSGISAEEVIPPEILERIGTNGRHLNANQATNLIFMIQNPPVDELVGYGIFSDATLVDLRRRMQTFPRGLLPVQSIDYNPGWLPQIPPQLWINGTLIPDVHLAMTIHDQTGDLWVSALFTFVQNYEQVDQFSRPDLLNDAQNYWRMRDRQERMDAQVTALRERSDDKFFVLEPTPPESGIAASRRMFPGHMQDVWAKGPEGKKAQWQEGLPDFKKLQKSIFAGASEVLVQIPPAMEPIICAVAELESAILAYYQSLGYTEISESQHYTGAYGNLGDRQALFISRMRSKQGSTGLHRIPTADIVVSPLKKGEKDTIISSVRGQLQESLGGSEKPDKKLTPWLRQQIELMLNVYADIEEVKIGHMPPVKEGIIILERLTNMWVNVQENLMAWIANAEGTGDKYFEGLSILLGVPYDSINGLSMVGKPSQLRKDLIDYARSYVTTMIEQRLRMEIAERVDKRLAVLPESEQEQAEIWSAIEPLLLYKDTKARGLFHRGRRDEVRTDGLSAVLLNEKQFTRVYIQGMRVLELPVRLDVTDLPLLDQRTKDFTTAKEAVDYSRRLAHYQAALDATEKSGMIAEIQEYFNVGELKATYRRATGVPYYDEVKVHFATKKYPSVQAFIKDWVTATLSGTEADQERARQFREFFGKVRPSWLPEGKLVQHLLQNEVDQIKQLQNPQAPITVIDAQVVMADWETHIKSLPSESESKRWVTDDECRAYLVKIVDSIQKSDTDPERWNLPVLKLKTVKKGATEPLINSLIRAVSGLVTVGSGSVERKKVINFLDQQFAGLRQARTERVQSHFIGAWEKAQAMLYAMMNEVYVQATNGVDDPDLNRDLVARFEQLSKDPEVIHQLITVFAKRARGVLTATGPDDIASLYEAVSETARKRGTALKIRWKDKAENKVKVTGKKNEEEEKKKEARRKEILTLISYTNRVIPPNATLLKLPVAG